jgi:hypothetical protein
MSYVRMFVVFAITVSLVAQESRPSVSYGPSRTSTGFIDTPIGRVAVDQGVSWQGVKVYLSLTWELVAVDETTGKASWNQSVGAFWNEIGFVELETSPRVKAWFVELRPGPRIREGGDRRQYHDLRTGKRFDLPEPLPAGRQIALDGLGHGDRCALDAPAQRLVGSDADWKAFVLEKMFAGHAAPKMPIVDFVKHRVVVLALGRSVNCSGLDLVSAWEDDRRILLRVDELTYQTMGPGGGGENVTPWGVFVIPRREPFKPVIVERNAQGLIGGPPIWKELCRFAGTGDAEKKTAPQRAGR